MKSAYLLVAFLVLSVAAWAGEEEGFKSSRARHAMRQYDAEIERAKQEAVRKIEAARRKYQAALDREMKAATRRADLDEANKLNAEKKRIEGEIEVGVKYAAGAEAEANAPEATQGGARIYRYGSGAVIRLLDDQTCTYTRGRGVIRGEWKETADLIVIDWKNGNRDIWKKNDQADVAPHTQDKKAFVKRLGTDVKVGE